MFIKNKTIVACRVSGIKMCISKTYLLCPLKRISVIEEVRVRRFVDIQDTCHRAFWSCVILESL